MAFFAPIVGPLFKYAVPDLPGSELRNAVSSFIIATASGFLGSVTYIGTLKRSERVVFYAFVMGALNGYFASNQYIGLLKGSVGQVSIQLISASFYDYLISFIYYTNPTLSEDVLKMVFEYADEIVKGAMQTNKAPRFG